MHFSSQQHEMLGCMFVTCIDICKHIIFTVQSDHHGTSIRFHFHVRLKPLCMKVILVVNILKVVQMFKWSFL